MCQSQKEHKLGPRTVECVFLGYAFHSVGYRFLIVKSGVPDMYEGTIMESRDVIFFEDVFPMKETPSVSSKEPIISPEPTIPVTHDEPSLVENPIGEDSEAPLKSKRQRTIKSFGDDFIVYLVDDTPRTIAKAYSSQDADYWKEAV